MSSPFQISVNYISSLYFTLQRKTEKKKKNQNFHSTIFNSPSLSDLPFSKNIYVFFISSLSLLKISITN
jgi:hypothetical protein